MKVLEQMKHKYASRLSIEAKTPVNEVQYTPAANHSHPYALQTSRGTIRARQVVYCTNGYTGHLLPQLRGRIFPKRGTMTVQDLRERVPNQGSTTSWNLHQQPRYDQKTDSVLNGSYYLQQNARSGCFFFGGEAQTAFTALTPDDSNASTVSVQHLQNKLPEFFGLEFERSDKLISSWSGIMGFYLRLLTSGWKVAQISHIARRRGRVDCCRIQRGGMCLCWRTGEAVAKMIYEQDVSGWFPAAFEVSPERLERRLTTERSVRSMEYLLLRNNA